MSISLSAPRVAYGLQPCPGNDHVSGFRRMHPVEGEFHGVMMRQVAIECLLHVDEYGSMAQRDPLHRFAVAPRHLAYAIADIPFNKRKAP